ncbi:XRE family transcriptional regulator [Rickettsiales endosymbiont of Peranema trichophorum]|uniref:helix-turn-helix domain-containing protein n=1 Tax=Rickettsiales endosymbiont of Peranema trichophorum TaxID=2486577 RepID=UPI001023AEC3|nr:helix-turn-helix transcriptional regulator [Rickettsiales endosymbiont of Peranema trichophorum]RZI47480.1 XRE family transcriptional regulator [Rickettsiales endosymbiont of Peranema trichophorum]
MQFIEIIIRLLDNTILTMKDISHVSGIQYNTLLYIRSSSPNDLKLNTAIKLADFFNISLSQLIGHKEIDYDKLVISRQHRINLFNHYINLNISETLQDLLNKHSMSTHKLSKILCMSYSTIYDLCKGVETVPALSSLIKVANYFQIDIEELIYGPTFSLYRLTNEHRQVLPIIGLDSIPEWCQAFKHDSTFPISQALFIHTKMIADVAIIKPTFTHNIWDDSSLLLVKSVRILPYSAQYVIAIINNIASILQRNSQNCFTCLKTNQLYSYVELHIVGEVVGLFPNTTT